MTQRDNIEYLARELNIDSGGSSSQLDRMKKIASAVGMSDYDGLSNSDTDELERRLREKHNSLLSTRYNNDSEKEEDIKKKLWNMLPSKYKFIVIGVIAFFIFTVLFLVVMVTPLMEIGVIDITGISGRTVSSSSGYTSVNGKTGYWWPIGSSEVTISDGVNYASGAPVSTTITSSFSTREDPYSGELIQHAGIDIASTTGTYGVENIIAAKDGKVIYPTSDDTLSCTSNPNEDSCGMGYGNYVMIEHGDGTVTLYAHLYENSITVRAGDTVKQGQIIGKMGSSGRSTGSHLHFEIRVNGNRVDPENYVDSSNPRPTTSNISYVIGDSNKQTVCLTLKSIGIPNNGVAAIMTNMKYESGFNPTALGDKGTSYGLCQWHNGRYDNLRNSFPDTYSTIGSQIEYLMYELENRYTSVYSSVMDDSVSVYDSTYKFCAKFEVPANTKSTCTKRANNSSGFEDYVNNGCQ